MRKHLESIAVAIVVAAAILASTMQPAHAAPRAPGAHASKTVKEQGQRKASPKAAKPARASRYTSHANAG